MPPEDPTHPATGEPGSGPAAVEVERGKGRFIVFVNGGEDKKVQYLTAKEIMKFWGKGDFHDLLERMKKGENIVLFRADSEPEAKSLVDGFNAIGAKAWIAEQKQIAGHDVF